MERVLQIPAIIWVLANTLSDLLIASAMLYHLRRVWVRDGYLSNHVLVSVVRLTVETNLVTTSVSIVSLLMMVVFPENIYYLCPTYVLGKLYSNTLLVFLNNRISTRDMNVTRGVVINRQIVAVPNFACSQGTTDTMVSEVVKPREGLMKQPATECAKDVM
ncbi:hypothetical protein BJV77DRAFT_163721 [Russula vinacea]|nr:hypothetical protein BJV77DRAFT_163721 [Russula vinacea]